MQRRVFAHSAAIRAGMVLEIMKIPEDYIVSLEQQSLITPKSPFTTL